MNIVDTFTGYVEIRYRSRVVKQQPAHDVRCVDQDHRFFPAQRFENDARRDAADWLENERDTCCGKVKTMSARSRYPLKCSYRTRKLENRWTRECLDCHAPSNLSGPGWQLWGSWLPFQGLTATSSWRLTPESAAKSFGTCRFLASASPVHSSRGWKWMWQGWVIWGNLFARLQVTWTLEQTIITRMNNDRLISNDAIETYWLVTVDLCCALRQQSCITDNDGVLTVRS